MTPGTHSKMDFSKLLDDSNHIAEYLTELPSRKLLEEKLHTAIKRTLLRLGDKAEPDSFENGEERS